MPCWYKSSPVQYTELHVPPQIKFDFSFDEAREAAWDQKLEELRLFAEANGGVAHVSKGDPERPELGTWCDNQARSPPLARQLIGPGRRCTWPLTRPEESSTRKLFD